MVPFKCSADLIVNPVVDIRDAESELLLHSPRAWFPSVLLVDALNLLDNAGWITIVNQLCYDGIG